MRKKPQHKTFTKPKLAKVNPALQEKQNCFIFVHDHNQLVRFHSACEWLVQDLVCVTFEEYLERTSDV